MNIWNPLPINQKVNVKDQIVIVWIRKEELSTITKMKAKRKKGKNIIIPLTIELYQKSVIIHNKLLNSFSLVNHLNHINTGLKGKIRQIKPSIRTSIPIIPSNIQEEKSIYSRICNNRHYTTSNITEVSSSFYKHSE